METLRIIDVFGKEYDVNVPGQIHTYLIALHYPPFDQDELYQANDYFRQIADEAKKKYFPPDKES